MNMDNNQIQDDGGRGRLSTARQDFSDITADRQPPDRTPVITSLTPASTPHAVVGTVLRVTIYAESWDNHDTIETLNCGSFEICGIRLSGPPSEATIEAISLSLQSPIRREEHTQGWEWISLYQIAQEVANRGSLSLVYELRHDRPFDRVDQRRESDLSFLTRIARDRGAAVKIIGNQLVIYSEQEFESKPPVLTIKRGDNRLLSYSFTQDTSDCASSAEVMHKDPYSGQMAWAVYPEDFAETGSAVGGGTGRAQVLARRNMPAVANKLVIDSRPIMDTYYTQ
jgi:hypothetical protein